MIANQNFTVYAGNELPVQVTLAKLVAANVTLIEWRAALREDQEPIWAKTSTDETITFDDDGGGNVLASFTLASAETSNALSDAYVHQLLVTTHTSGPDLYTSGVMTILPTLFAGGTD